MKTKNKIDDNKALRAQSAKELLVAAISVGKNSLSAREQFVLMEVLINQKTFAELTEGLQLTRSRVKVIFQNGTKRLNNIFNGINRRVIAYDEMEKELIGIKKKLAKKKEEIDKQKKISPELKATLSLSVSDLDFSARLTKVFYDANIYTVADIVKLQRLDFLKLRNFGKSSMSELEDFVESKNLSWNMAV